MLFQLLPLFWNLETISLDFPTVESESPVVFTPPLVPPGLVGVTLKYAPTDVPFLPNSAMHVILGTISRSLVPYNAYSAPTNFQVDSLNLDGGGNHPRCLNWLVSLLYTFAHLQKLSIDMFDYLHHIDVHGRAYEFLERCSSFSKC